MIKSRLGLENVPGTGSVYRVIDANLNRTREALRVCEDVTRFILDDKPLTKSLKDIRHGVGARCSVPLHARNVNADIGRKSSFDKTKPKNIKSLFYNNIHRAEESIRSLEEFSKLAAPELSGKFKALRFKVYAIEKKTIKKLMEAPFWGTPLKEVSPQTKGCLRRKL